MENLRLDFRFALRQLVKQPAFTVTAMPTLALGVAASVAVFGFVDAALIEPLLYPEPDASSSSGRGLPQGGLVVRSGNPS